MKLPRRAAAEDVEADVVATGTLQESQKKGRPTPKRRDAQGRRGPVSAPTSRKEAYARQKQMAKAQKTSTIGAATKPKTAAEQRAAMKRGDPAYLPKRDQGQTKKLARDYVDSKRLLCSYMLVLFPLFIAASLVPALRILELACVLILVAMLIEMYIVGRRIRALSLERFDEAQGSAMSIGWYAGSRAYLLRKWRLPAPQIARGAEF